MKRIESNMIRFKPKLQFEVEGEKDDRIVFESLIDFNNFYIESKEKIDKSEPEILNRKYSITDDGKTYKIQIRKGILKLIDVENAPSTLSSRVTALEHEYQRLIKYINDLFPS